MYSNPASGYSNYSVIIRLVLEVFPTEKRVHYALRKHFYIGICMFKTAMKHNY